MDQRDETIRALREELEAKRTAPPKGGAVMGTLKVLGTLAAVGIGGLVLLLIIGSILPDEDAGKSYGDRVKEACEEQVGHRGEIAVNDCQIQIMAGELYRQRGDEQSRAAREAGRP